MKKTRRAGSLFGLLARNYLLFSLTLLLIAGGVYFLWNNYLDEISLPSDWDGLLADADLAGERYDRLRHYLRSDGSAFVICAEDGTPVYSSDADVWSLTAGEFACIQPYFSSSYVDVQEEVGEDGRTYRVLTRYLFDTDGFETVDAVMTLDAGLNVVSGGFGDGRSSYTRREFNLLVGNTMDGFDLYREDFVTSSGKKRAAVLFAARFDMDEYVRAYNASWKIWLLFVPLYVLAAGGFIWWLDRRIRRPLERLNAAVEAQTEGRTVHVGNSGGPLELRRIGESFDRLSDRLDESEQERRRLDEGRQKLIADISHDLRTPVTVISGYADAICDGKVPPEEAERYLGVIREKSAALTELIDAFHEYSKVEHPEFQLRPQRVDLCEYTREYLAKKYDEIDLAGFSLEVNIPEREVYCMLDELQFRRVLDNLLSNSLRHNRLGTMLFFDLLPGPEYAELRVADNGAGIPPERAKTVFEPFVVGSDSRSGGGSGLGLAITRRIVELHGGTITLRSRPDAGRSTEFVVRLPVSL